MSDFSDYAFLRFLSGKLVCVTGIQYDGSKDRPDKPHRFCSRARSCRSGTTCCW